MLKYKILLITCLLISFSSVSYSQSGWYVCFQISSYDFFSVHFINNNVGYVLDAGGRVLKTNDGGINWSEIATYLGDVIDIDFVNEQTGFICGDTYCSILKTTDGGYNWQTKALYNQYMFDIDFIDSNTGFAVGEGGYIVKTTNSGINWFQLYSPPNSSFYSISVVNPLTIFVTGNRTIKTTNGGSNWIDITPVPNSFSGYFASVYFVNKDSGIVTNWTRIYSTTNTGQSWNSYNDSIWYHDIIFSDDKTAYACGNNGSIIKTTNNGLTWYRKPTNVNNILTALYFTSVNTGYCVGQGGVILKTTNGGEPIGIKPISNEVPAFFSLSQNYPNPFNPATKIRFNIPLSRGVSERRGVLVNLTIYDALGREVVVLINEQLSPGTYETEWDGSNYPSGVYFYKLTARDYSDTKKMVLIR